MNTNGSDFGPGIEAPDVLLLSTQRSGTHFLQACLASHPGVVARGECLLLYERIYSPDPAKRLPTKAQPPLKNAPGCNIAVVMYSQVGLCNLLWGNLYGLKIIHLIRDATTVARSVEQMRADRAANGQQYRSHQRLDTPPPQHVEFDKSKIAATAAQVKVLQNHYKSVLAYHPKVLTVSYEEFTSNQQTSQLAEEPAKKLLSFLGLPDHPLTNSLRKTGTSSE